MVTARLSAGWGPEQLSLAQLSSAQPNSAQLNSLQLLLPGVRVTPALVHTHGKVMLLSKITLDLCAVPYDAQKSEMWEIVRDYPWLAVQ